MTRRFSDQIMTPPRAWRQRMNVMMLASIFGVASNGLTLPSAYAQALPTAALAVDAQPLGNALLQLAQQLNIQIYYPHHLVEGKYATAIAGQLSVEEALSRVLAGTGLQFERRGNGYRVVDGSTVAQGDTSAQQENVPSLSSITIEGKEQFATIYTQEDIANTPSSNQDISSLLVDNPSVRFGEESNSSLNRGSMSVDEISIHGASPFQNLFSIDGFGATNNLDPAEKNGNLKPSTIPSNSQAYFLDTSLLDSVVVYDRNIPVEYGGFTGGVVDARLKRAGMQNTARASYRWNTSKLTKQKIAEGSERSWERGQPGYAPAWKKDFYTLATELRLSPELGLTLSASKRKSMIERYQVVEFEGRNTQEQSRFADQVDNVLAKISYAYVPSSFVDLTLKYSDRREQVVSDTLRETAWRNKHDARGLSVVVDHQFEAGDKFELRAGWDYMGSHQNSAVDSLVTYMKPGMQTYTSGGYGKNEKAKDVYSVGARYNLALWQLGALQNTSYVGVDTTHTRFRFKRYQDSYSMVLRENAAGVVTETNKVLNQQGRVGQRYSTVAAYAANQTQWRDFSINVGARLDHDNLFKNTNFSPRANVEWDLFGDNRSVVSLGRSRYYGSEILNLAIREGIESLRFRILDSKGNSNYSGSSVAVDYAGLKSPYNDEWTFGVQQSFGGFQGDIAYVRRYGRQQVTREEIGDQYRYTNDGYSKNDSVAITLRQTTPLKVGPSYWTATAQFGWQRTRRNTDYDVGYESDGIDAYTEVFYNGARILHRDLPLASFYQPRQMSFNLNAQLPSYGVRWANTFRWRSKKTGIVYVGRKDRLDSYESARLGAYWLWDSKVVWEPTFARGLELSVEVLNALNKMPPILAGNPNVRLDRTVYRSGRELWFQVGYRY